MNVHGAKFLVIFLFFFHASDWLYHYIPLVSNFPQFPSQLFRSFHSLDQFLGNANVTLYYNNSLGAALHVIVNVGRITRINSLGYTYMFFAMNPFWAYECDTLPRCILFPFSPH